MTRQHQSSIRTRGSSLNSYAFPGWHKTNAMLVTNLAPLAKEGAAGHKPAKPRWLTLATAGYYQVATA